MRRVLVALVLFVASVPIAGAQNPQDALLDELANYGDADYFTRYTGLLIVKVSMLGQLQAGQVSTTDLAELSSVMDRLRTLRQTDLNLTDPTYEDIRPTYEGLASLRAGLETLSAESVQSYQPLLRLAIDRQLQTLIDAVDDLAATRNQTAERVQLLRYGRDAAQIIQNPVDYSRLDAAHRRLDEQYRADTARAADAVAHGNDLVAQGTPPLASAQFPAYYAELLAADRALEQARLLYEHHGESDNAATALSTQTQVGERANDMAVRILVPILGALALVIGLGFLAAQRIVEWAYVRSAARAGDELALQV